MITALQRLTLSILCAGGWGCGSDAELSVSKLDAPSAVSGLQSADPALEVLPGSGDLVLSWIQGDGKTWGLYTARSRGGDGRWSSPVKVAGGPDAPGEVHPHGESSPRLVVAPDERMALVWPNSITVPGRKWPAAMLRFASSHDGGLTWSRPITLNDDTTGALVSHQFHGATWVGDSGLIVAWLDERDVAGPVASGTDGHAEHATEPDATIYLATSTDFGRSWSPNRVGWKAACPCCRVTLARTPERRVVAAWRMHFPGNVRDVVTAILSEKPSEPRRVHPDDWAYAGCPHTGPALSIGRDSSTHVAWYNGKQAAVGVYYARQANGKGTADAVELVSGSAIGVAHPAVAALPDGGALAAYDVSAEGVRMIRIARIGPDGRILARGVVTGSDGGKYPQLAILGDTAAVVAWTATVGDGFQMRLARVTVEQR